MKNLRNIFQRKRKKQQQDPQPLRIEGVAAAPMTPEPDDAELAAQALLEKMVESQGTESLASLLKSRSREAGKAGEGTAAYYRELAERIRAAHTAARLRTSRFLSFCEQELKKPDLPLEGEGSLGLLEAELYKRIDTVEHDGGELKERWQHCLAVVTVRMMNLPNEE